MKTWFKFYGQEFLSDPKMLSLSPVEKALWLTILCLASSSEEEGIIRYITEEKIMDLTGLDRMREEWKEAEGFLKKFKKLRMVKLDNEDGEIVIKVVHYEKRQNKVLSPYERLKSYRERQKTIKKIASNDNEMITSDNAGDNDRIDKNREEKNILNTGNASPEIKKFEKLEEAKSNLVEKLSLKRNGISTSWQDKAFRYAKSLDIKLDDRLKSRWLKIFKQASEGRKTKNIERAYSYLADYPKLLNSEQKIKFFFWIYENGITPSYLAGFSKLKIILLGFILGVVIFLSSFFLVIHPKATTGNFATVLGKSLNSGPVNRRVTGSSIEKIIYKIHGLESTWGQAKSGLHVYCRNKGIWNEYGYDSSHSFCFKNKQEADDTLTRYFSKRLYRDGMTISQSLCYYNTGKPLISCDYSKKSGL